MHTPRFTFSELYLSQRTEPSCPPIHHRTYHLDTMFYHQENVINIVTHSTTKRAHRALACIYHHAHLIKDISILPVQRRCTLRVQNIRCTSTHALHLAFVTIMVCHTNELTNHTLIGRVLTSPPYAILTLLSQR